jgi:hypothetical protein
MTLLRATQILMVILICACSNQSRAATGQECWKHVVSDPEKSKNRLSICFSGQEASLNVFYPNNWLRLIPPTNCRSSGTTSATPEGVDFDFPAGNCENGEVLKRTQLKCKRTGSSLACKHKGKDLEFLPVGTRP